MKSKSHGLLLTDMGAVTENYEGFLIREQSLNMKLVTFLFLLELFATRLAWFAIDSYFSLLIVKFDCWEAVNLINMGVPYFAVENVIMEKIRCPFGAVRGLSFSASWE